MSDLAKVRIVAGREIRETARRRTIWIASGVLFLAAVASIVVPSLLSNDDSDRLGLFGDVPTEASAALVAVGEAAGMDVETVRLDDRDAAVSEVEDGEVAGAIGFLGGIEFISEAGEDSTLEAVVRESLTSVAIESRLEESGLGEPEIAEALAPAQVEVTTLETGSGERRGVAAVASVVLYVLLLGLMNMVANSVAIEKVHGVSEVLLPNVGARTLLVGKVLGIWAIGMIPLAVGSAPLLVRALTGGTFPPGTATVLASGVAWYVLGAGLYLFAAGALGSLVERQEEVGSAVSSLSVVLVVSYIASFAPDSTISAVLAWVPFSSPMVEPPRIATGVAAPVEIAGSFLLLLVGTVVVARVATTVYRRAIVRTDTRLRLREVLAPDR